MKQLPRSPRVLHLVLVVCYMSLPLQGQNLIQNPSFETFTKCPKEKGNISTDVAHWYVATLGTTDYFNECGGLLGVPNNFNGVQQADFGKGYAGMYLLAPNNYREYLQGQFSETLVKGMRYQLSFYISLADKSSLSVKDIGVVCSEKRLSIATNKVLKSPWEISRNNRVQFMEISTKSHFGNKQDWVQLQTEFIAMGSENYITIGNFRTDDKTRKHTLSRGKPAAYYYVDMVSLTPLDLPRFTDQLLTDTTYVFEHILFGTDQYQLGAPAKQELDTLYMALRKDPALTVAIHAHTDTDGKLSYNKDLSVKRAEAVAQYLMEKGLAKHRILWQGHGGKYPIAANTTPMGKQKNRRVEFKISKAKDNLADTKFEDNED